MEHLSLTLRTAQAADLSFLTQYDHHISADMMQRKIAAGEILIAFREEVPIGLLRWGWFWDNVPFMNLLFVLERWRGQRVATRLIATWETHMREAGAEFVFTSTYASETAQHLYRKSGYQDIGGFVLPHEPLELILMKPLRP